VIDRKRYQPQVSVGVPVLSTKRGPATSRVVAQLSANRQATLDAVALLGSRKVMVALKRAQLTLQKRLPSINPQAEFTTAAQRQTLEQLNLMVRMLKVGVRQAVVEQSHAAAEQGADGMLRYLVDAEKAYRGISTLGPRIEDAVRLDVAVAGADATVLRRVATDPGYRGSPAQAGVMDRYGIAVISQFETTMQQALLTNQSWGETRQALMGDSDWLATQPLYWSERILRTESLGASNRAGHECMRQAEEELGPVLRILSSVFDSRTGADSMAVHGQVRRMEEPFDTWYGPCMTPPDRPNDRAVVVPHMQDWDLPPELMPVDDSVVAARWAEQTASKKHPGGRPGMPPRPLMSTVPGFGMP
jgi:hypothetical protein